MKKVISLVLTMLMIFSVFTVLPSASATETYVAGTEVKVIVSLPETDAFTAVEGTVTYGSSLEYVADSLAFPHIIDPVENTSEVGSIYFNSSSLDPVCDISDDHILLTANFTVLEDVSAIDVVTAIDDIFIVEGTTMNAVSSVTETTVEVVSVPTQPTEPTTESTQPTEPEVTEPEATEPEATEPEATEPAPVGDVTIRFAAPTSSINRYDWVDPVLVYGNSSSLANNTTIALTATDEVYYTAEVGVSTLLSAEGWTIYEVTLTEDQIAAIDNSNIVAFSTANGVSHTAFYSSANVLKAGVDTFGTYATTKKGIAEVSGATFVIQDAASAKDYVSYKGYWVTEYTNVKFAAPVSNTKRSTWDVVELYYADNGVAYENATKIQMVNTFETTKIADVGDMSTLKAGRWYIFAASVDPTQAAAINAAAKFGFAKPGDTNKTSFSKNCLLAKIDEYDGTYNTTKSTIEELEGYVFVVQAKASANSLLTFLGEWQSEPKYTEGKDDTVTIYFAAPKGVSATADWNTGVELYYGKTTLYRDTNRLTMTKTDKTVAVDTSATNLTTLVSGDWEVYSLELTVEQIRAIDDSNNVGFIKTGSYNRTSILQTKNITRASRVEESTAYTSAKETIEAFEGYTFVINDLFDTANERTSYLGSWIVV